MGKRGEMKNQLCCLLLILSLLASLIGWCLAPEPVSAVGGGQQVWYITDTLALAASPSQNTGSNPISPPQAFQTSAAATAAITMPAGHWRGYICLSSSYNGGANISVGYGAGENVNYIGTQTLTASTYQNGFNLDIDAGTMSISPGDSVYLKFLTGNPNILTGSSRSYIFSPSGSPAFPDPAQTTTYGLTISVNGSGSTSPAASTTTYSFYNGTVVPVSATAANGYHFSGWSGALSGTTNPSTVTVTSAQNLTANFEQESSPTYNLTMAISPAGAGTTSPAAGAHSYSAGTNVPIQATAANGYTFVNWTGSTIANPNAASTTVTADQNKTITANFMASAAVNLVLSPSTSNNMIGDTFDVILQAQSGSQQVVGVDAYLDFDPAKLAVVDMDPAVPGCQIASGAAFSMPIRNTADNTAGHIDYSAGAINPLPSGTFTVATIRFQALAATAPTTAITFSTSDVRHTEVCGDIQGTDVTGTLTGGVCTIASGVNVGISVGLQGAGRPANAWAVPLTVKFFTPGSNVLTAVPLFSFTLTAAKVNSTAVVQCPGVSPASYDISAVSSHTLVNVKRNVTIGIASTTISLGTLLEGNANNDVRINIADFSFLSGAYGKSSGEPGYNAGADFDGSGIVDINDFSLLAGNYNRRSPIEVP